MSLNRILTTLHNKCDVKSVASLLVLYLMFRSLSSGVKMSEKLISIDFEIFGRVQQVFFRKCTQEKATELGLRGWCKNTPQGTVQGQAQGPEKQIEAMKLWLMKTGSPQSRIDKAEFKNVKQIEEYNFADFGIQRRPR